MPHWRRTRSKRNKRKIISCWIGSRSELLNSSSSIDTITNHKIQYPLPSSLVTVKKASLIVTSELERPSSLCLIFFNNCEKMSSLIHHPIASNLQSTCVVIANVAGSRGRGARKKRQYMWDCDKQIIIFKKYITLVISYQTTTIRRRRRTHRPQQLSLFVDLGSYLLQRKEWNKKEERWGRHDWCRWNFRRWSKKEKRMPL